MSRLVPIKFGPRNTDMDVEGRRYSELPGMLSDEHDTEIPENVEIYADDKLVEDLNERIPEGVRAIDITAVAGQKQG